MTRLQELQIQAADRRYWKEVCDRGGPIDKLHIIQCGLTRWYDFEQDYLFGHAVYKARKRKVIPARVWHERKMLEVSPWAHR